MKHMDALKVKETSSYIGLFGWLLSAVWLCESGPLERGYRNATNLLVSGEPGPGCFDDGASLDLNLFADNQTQSSCTQSLAHNYQTVPASRDASTHRYTQPNVLI